MIRQIDQTPHTRTLQPSLSSAPNQPTHQPTTPRTPHHRHQAARLHQRRRRAGRLLRAAAHAGVDEPAGDVGAGDHVLCLIGLLVVLLSHSPSLFIPPHPPLNTRAAPRNATQCNATHLEGPQADHVVVRRQRPAHPRKQSPQLLALLPLALRGGGRRGRGRGGGSRRGLCVRACVFDVCELQGWGQTNHRRTQSTNCSALPTSSCSSSSSSSS